MNKINVLITGSSGYIGIELIKILAKHKYVNIKYLCGNSSVGKNISYYDKTIKTKLPKIRKFSQNLLSDVDVIFSALPNRDAQRLSKKLLKKNILIDLSADFRIKNAKNYSKWYKKKHLAVENIRKSIYSIPELNKDEIKNYKIISCPGCYPTSILIPLIPLLKEKLIKNNNIVIDSKSGYSGAGRNVHKKFKNKNLYQSLSPYGIATHRHNSELEQELNKASKKKVGYIFTPHITSMFRGIVTNIYVDLSNNVSISRIQKCLKKYYKDSSFVKIMRTNTILGSNSVINTNNCKISPCKTSQKNKIILISTIDNLIKGGAGQAVQNFNVRYNFKNNEGLL